MVRHTIACVAAALALVLMAGTSVAANAEPNQNGNGQNSGQKGQNVNPAATPELDSALLFVFGAAGVLTPMLAQRRRSRKKDADPTA